VQGFQKQSFALAAHTCFNNVGVIRMYIVAGFRMLLLTFPSVPGLYSAPGIPFAFRGIRERTCPTGDFYFLDLFECFLKVFSE